MTQHNYCSTNMFDCMKKKKIFYQYLKMTSLEGEKKTWKVSLFE